MTGSIGLAAFVDELIRRAAKARILSGRLMKIRAQYGTVEAVSRLVQSGDVQGGFKRLKQLGMLEWMIESAVLKFPEGIFTRNRASAAFRIRLVEEEGDEKS
jgi:hypothetical protein